MEFIRLIVFNVRQDAQPTTEDLQKILGKALLLSAKSKKFTML